MKEFVNKPMTRKVPFMDGEVEVKLLTVGDAKAIEVASKKINRKKEATTDDQMELLRLVIRLAVVGAEDISDEEFESFPITELSKLSETIMNGESKSEGND